MDTKHRLSKRDSFEEILKSKFEISNVEYIADILFSMSSIVCILNDKNQVVFSNDRMLEKYNLDLEKNILGVRPGEIFNCIHSKNNTGGCGTSEKCKYCGAKTAFDEAWEGSRKVTHECKISSQEGSEIFQLDLEVTATPIRFEKDYLIVSINDITNEKRKALLERIFFHDVLNIAGSLSGILELMPTLTEEEREEFLQIAGSLTEQIIEEIKGQQQVLKAESGELQVHLAAVDVRTLLDKVVNQIRFHNVSNEKQVQVVNESALQLIHTDQTLLIRVLINMVKNAMEAVSKGEQIVLKASDLPGRIRFSVHNQTYIPLDIQMQIFQRSYSTKGHNRGLGTYSMKLLGENYLKGQVDFASGKVEGTVFYIDLPV